jgi:hypothetical protein
MNKLIKSLVLASAGVLVNAHAQGDVQTVNIPILCSTSDVMSKLLTKYDEDPALAMITLRETKEKDKPRSNTTLLFINYETQSWTLLERMADNVFCIISNGSRITPYVDKSAK